MADAAAGEALLATACDLVARGWCRGAEARDDANRPVDPWTPEARCWSLLGALVAAADLPEEAGPAALGPLRRALGALADVIDEPLLARWNDAPGRTQQEVVAVLEAARRRCAGG